MGCAASNNNVASANNTGYIEAPPQYEGKMNQNNNGDVVVLIHSTQKGCPNGFDIKYNNSNKNYDINLSISNIEHFINLKSPCLLGDNNLPFKIEFNMRYNINDIAKNNGVGRHGGIYFGFPVHVSRANIITRWYGNRTIKEGAKCTSIDWIDRNSDFGFRMYGTTKEYMRYEVESGKKEAMLNNGFDGDGKWTINFYKNNKCTFYYDDMKVFDFICLSSNGCIGFWAHDGCGMNISNLVVEKIYGESGNNNNNNSDYTLR